MSRLPRCGGGDISKSSGSSILGHRDAVEELDHKRLNVWRRLNLLIYLNSTWDESWGGHLELGDRGAKSCIKRIAPIFNRAVIFSTSNFSYHGHPHSLNCPDGEARRSLALYYYTVDYPYAEDTTPHTTVFVEPAPFDRQP